MEFASKSPGRGESPSKFAVPAKTKDRRLAAKERARINSRARAALKNSGYVVSFARQACCKAALAVRPAARRGAPAAVRGDTKVVSTASCTPPTGPTRWL